MSILDYIAEQRIREAINNGEFDHLEGFGKPIDLSDYFSVPADDRVAFHILKNSGVVPEEIELRKSIYHLVEKIRHSADNEEISALERRKLELEDKLFVLRECRRERR